ncbi:MAG: DNA repair protein RadA [Candidatus Cyclobacteriaceae bacterium M3_2C_046]
MAKTKTTFFCQSCGAQSPKWLGKCPGCGEWNTYVEEVVKTEKSGKHGWQREKQQLKVAKPRLIHQIESQPDDRIDSNNQELNRVLGGGLVKGSVILIGGEPGIGKSTLMLQVALQLPHMKILYISGEESESQIRMRAERMGQQQSQCYVLTETSTQNIFLQVEQVMPDLVIIDSIQTLHSDYIEASAGSVSQVRQCTAELIKFAKETSTPVFLIGHITKEGTIAGPKILEHMVDTVLQFEGDQHYTYRILRTTKNRFGSTAELGIYEMSGTGLKEISNPSEILITQRDQDLSGVAIGATIEGNRPLLIEIQSLVSPATYGTPQRSSTGFDLKRLNMLLAVLEKRGGFRLSNQDVFLNIAGGIKVEDPAMDLAVCVSIVSSLEEIPVADKICFAAEVGLGGELRAVNRIESRISEADKLGFRQVFISKFNKTAISSSQKQMNVTSLGKLEDIFSDLFG